VALAEGGTGGAVIKASELKEYLEESRGLERDYLTELVRSRRTAWRVAAGEAALVVLALIALVALLPLKRVEGFVVRVDNARDPSTSCARFGMARRATRRLSISTG
jgi:type IV secretion system protein VirB8